MAWFSGWSVVVSYGKEPMAQPRLAPAAHIRTRAPRATAPFPFRFLNPNQPRSSHSNTAPPPPQRSAHPAKELLRGALPEGCLGRLARRQGDGSQRR